MKQVVLNSWQENGALSVINQTQLMIMLSITQKYLSNLCDYNNAYILVRGDITIIGHIATQVAFKNCAPFIKSITKIDVTT